MKYLLLLSLLGFNAQAGIAELRLMAKNSGCGTYPWKERGVASRYVEGMGLVYGRAYCKLRASNTTVNATSTAPGSTSTDSLAHYGIKAKAGAEALRATYTLLIGLGMRESSGRYCVGIDKSAKPLNDHGYDTEAGLFQTSYNAMNASPLMKRMYNGYKDEKKCFLDVFALQGTCRQSDFKDYGSGDHKQFQTLSKTCPAFAAELAALGLRVIRRHWGPINTKAAENLSVCSGMLLAVEKQIDSNAGLCKELL